MGFLKRLALLLTCIFAAFLAYKIHLLCQPPPLPKLDENAWWGPGKPSDEDASIRPFKVAVSDKVLEDLQARLKSSRPLTPPLEGVQQQYGFNTDLLKNISIYWQNDYKWRQRETFLNQFPQFKTKIQGLDVHFIHAKPKDVRALPLLLLHGWPGSVREFYKLIPLLTEPSLGRDFGFEVVAPSLPGFGFSEGAARPGLGDVQMAVVLKNLMKRLGHRRFYLQGGDWGAIIASHMATLFPQNVAGLHLNLCMVSGFKPYMKVLLGSIHPPWVVEKDFEKMMYPLGSKLAALVEASGYFHIQATKPDTVGVALNQSPIGLAAYILEKFSGGTNQTYKAREDGGLLDKFTYDELLDNVMIYWLANSATTAARIYAESYTRAQRDLGVLAIPIDKSVPCACARFAFEIAYFSDWILKDKYSSLVQTTDFTTGGHFAAFEEPELLAKDLFSAVAKMEDFNRATK